MSGRKVNPWQCPPDPTHCRLLHLSNLPPGCKWEHISPFFLSFHVEYYIVFGSQALVQFVNTQQAQIFYSQCRGQLSLIGYPIIVTFSCLNQLTYLADTPTRMVQSRVICIQVMKLRVSLGIQDIYDECSLFGIVEKIICFEKTGKFALVQMSRVEQASLALMNLTNSPRHAPCFQFRIQYSKNQDIVIKFNNSKSFDFTTLDAQTQFAQLREAIVGERPFFTVDESEIDPIFDFWRPVPFDSTFSSVISVSGFDDQVASCNFFHNLFSQYGIVRTVRISMGRRKVAFITFENNFYARIAMTFMSNCPINGKRLQIDFPSHSENHMFFQPQIDRKEYYDSFYNDSSYTEYPEREDFSIEDYSEFSFPTNLVKIKSGDLSQFNITENNIFDLKQKILKFLSIEEAAHFIGFSNTLFMNGQQIICSFFSLP